jgi:hypothetical protein
MIWRRIDVWLLRVWHRVRGGSENGATGALDSSTSRLKRFCVLASVVLREPQTVMETAEGGGGVAVGYFRNFGVTADSEQSAHVLVEQSVPDGSVIWPESATNELSASGVSKLIGRKPPLDLAAFRAETSGIWYESGHIFYMAE